MKGKLVLLFSALLLGGAIVQAAPLGTAISYQGRLDDSGSPANGTYSFRYRLVGDPAGATQIGPVVDLPNQTIADGLLNAPLDFGPAAFNGDARWLEISVKPGSPSDPGNYITLNPQPLTPAGSSQFAKVAGDVLNGIITGPKLAPLAVTTTHIGDGAITGPKLGPASISNGNLADNAITAAKIVNGQVVKSLNGLRDQVSIAVGSGLGLATNGSSLQLSALPPPDTAWSRSGNAGTTPGGSFLGTTDNQALELKVNGARAFRLEPNATSPNVVGGFRSNLVTSGIKGATIGGGGGLDWFGATPPNQVAGDYGTVGGGVGNVAGGPVSIIGGGERGTIDSSANNSTIGGGARNTVAAGAFDSTIGGGRENTTGNSGATIGGGFRNSAPGLTATIAGGAFNLAGGQDSFIGAGFGNVVQSYRATVGGGEQNRIETNAFHSTIAGGNLNVIGTNAIRSFIGGGELNRIRPDSAFSTVPGGIANEAGGFATFAAGRRAKATHDGSFVWADSLDADFASSALNQFLIRASGGVGIGTTDPAGAALRVAGTVRADGFSGPLSASQLTGTLAPTNLSANTPTAGQVLGYDGSSMVWQNLTGGWGLSGNSPPIGSFVGTVNNVALDVRVNNTRAWRVEPNATSPNLVGGWSGNAVDAGVSGATIAGGGVETVLGRPGTNRVADHFGTVGGGANNLAGLPGGDFQDGWFATVGGGQSNRAEGVASTIAGGSENRTSGNDTTVGGGWRNQAISVRATVSGGEANVASGSYSVIGGGLQNSGSGPGAVIAGGTLNSATADSATVPGGSNNEASGRHSFAAGRAARALHDGSFVWADRQGTVFSPTPFESTAPNQFRVRASGGISLEGKVDIDSSEALTAKGSAPFITLMDTDFAGYYSRIQAIGSGLHLIPTWRGANGSTQPGEVYVDGLGFRVKIDEQFIFQVGKRPVTGGKHVSIQEAELIVFGNASAVSFITISDRNAKRDFEPVDSRKILEAVVGLPIQSWRFTNDSPRIRHIGPMAQDFHAAFQVGPDEKHIATVDADGVALAAIQGMNQKLEEQRAESEAKDARIAALEEKLAVLQQTVTRLESHFTVLEHVPAGLPDLQSTKVSAISGIRAKSVGGSPRKRE